ncbi:MAG: serine hydrolase domain-containing protein, partial [Candidatus Aminicenantales bacterium]
MKALRLLFAFGACAVLISCQPHTDMLPFASPESVGMSSKRLELLDAAVESGIQRGDFPGAVVLVARKGRCVWRKSYGDSQTVPEKIPMEVSMIFDVASITKPVATATSLMILLEQGRIRLWDRVRDYVPEFTSCKGPETQPVDEARIWHLLTHTSGLPPYADPEEVKKAVEHPVTLEQLVSYIARMEKPYPPGERFQYSCLGYITLGYIIEKISGKTLAEFARENIFKPLGMRDTAFAPSEDLRSRCVPTLVIDGKPLVGEVHDPLARLLGGV